MLEVRFDGTFAGWQAEARGLLRDNTPPEQITWSRTGGDQHDLELFDVATHAEGDAPVARVPKHFVEAAKTVALHSDESRWALLYRVLWRLTHGEPHLLQNEVDADTLALLRMEKEVEKDAYRMRAFLRFRRTAVDGQEWYVAWYEPEHQTLETNADFFIDRFTNMKWSILTPTRCMHWDGSALSFSGGVQRSAAPADDELEPLWITYYKSIFKPARLKPTAMQAQLLKRNWKNLPEAEVIEPLIRTAPSRTGLMLESSERKRVRDSDYGTPLIPRTDDLAAIRSAASTCQACPLYRNATCTVFGEGPPNARLMLVGEQPGDAEDRAGKPFVGPAGQVLDRALAEANIDRDQVYTTNAVKHFKWEPRGKRRIHQTPNARDIAACRPWLEEELRIVKPKLVVALGGTAAHSLFGSPTRVMENRGRVLDHATHGQILVTVHPSSLLRLPPGSDNAAYFARFVADLRVAREWLARELLPDAGVPPAHQEKSA